MAGQNLKKRSTNASPGPKSKKARSHVQTQDPIGTSQDAQLRRSARVNRNAQPAYAVGLGQTYKAEVKATAQQKKAKKTAQTLEKMAVERDREENIASGLTKVAQLIANRAEDDAAMLDKEVAPSDFGSNASGTYEYNVPLTDAKTYIAVLDDEDAEVQSAPSEESDLQIENGPVDGSGSADESINESDAESDAKPVAMYSDIKRNRAAPGSRGIDYEEDTAEDEEDHTENKEEEEDLDAEEDWLNAKDRAATGEEADIEDEMDVDNERDGDKTVRPADGESDEESDTPVPTVCQILLVTPD
jgi:hypothetical protein